MTKVVKKYGGTLLRDAAGRQQVLDDVRAALERGHGVVAVVSAMGRAGDPYATDQLIALAEQVAACPAPNALDLLLSVGELVSASLMAMYFASGGVPAIPFSGATAGLITTREFGRARIQRLEMQRLERACERGLVPVVAGFQGMTEDLETTTLGRGGSDLTAVALGVGLHADVVEIVKEVEGVMTTDPTIVPEARLVPEISYEDLLLLTAMGSKVVQSEAVALAAQHGVTLHVKKPGAQEGTRVLDGERMRSLGGKRRMPVIAHRNDVALVTVRWRGDGSEPSELLGLLAESAGSCVYVLCDDTTLIACVAREAVTDVKAVLASMPEVADTVRPCEVVTIVGMEPEKASDLVAIGTRTLHRLRIPVVHAHHWTAGASFVLAGQDVRRALASIHELISTTQ
jgi:aspartate kinase